MTIRLELKQNKTIIICIQCGKQEATNEFDYLSQHVSRYSQSDNHLLLLGDFNAKIGNDESGIINGEPYISRNGALLRDMIKHLNLEILNNKGTEGKWTRINSNNINEKSIIDYIIWNNKLTKHIAKVIIGEKQDFVLTGKKKTDHNTISLKIAAEPKVPNKEKIKIWKINEETNWKTYENVIKQELKNIKLNQHCPNEAHRLLKNTILETAKTTIGKHQMADNILDHPQIRQKNKETLQT